MTEPNVRERVFNIAILFRDKEKDWAVKITAKTEVEQLCPDSLDLFLLTYEIEVEFGIVVHNGVP